jgi:hypothetical protein
MAEAATAEGDELVRLAQELERLIASTDASVRAQAALARLNASTEHKQVPWSDAAPIAVREVDEELAALLRAERLILEGERDVAEDLLLDHQENPRALEMLVDLALATDDLAKALRLAHTLYERAPSPVRRLLYADLLLRAGRAADGLEHLAAIRADREIATPVRARAFALSARQAWEESDFADAARLTAAWLALVPTSTAAAWAHIQALLRRSEYEAALRVDDKHDLTPRDIDEAHLAAYLFSRALAPVDALGRIVSLSDEFNGEDERLEALVVLTGLRVRDDLPSELAERRKTALEEFPRKFPNSQIIRALKAPETPEEIESFFREQFAEGADQQAAAEREVARGESPVTVLAALAHRDVGTTWGRLHRLPIGYGDATLNDLERADALAAIGGGVGGHSTRPH